MKNRNNLQDFKQRVDLYFDNALAKDDQERFLTEVSDDPHFHNVFNKEKTFRDFIKTNVRRSSVSPDLIQSIKDRVRQI